MDLSPLEKGVIFLLVAGLTYAFGLTVYNVWLVLK